MRKLTKKSLNELAKTLPVVEKEVQTSFVGGGNGSPNDPYTMDEFITMFSSGTWTFGFIEGQGFVGFNPGNEESPCSFSLYESLKDNNLWNGGFVDAFGYMGTVEAHIYGSSEYPGNVAQQYYSFADYIRSLSLDGLNQLASTILGSIPILGTYSNYWLQEMGDMQHYIQAELLEKGYDKNSSFDIVTSISLKEQKCAVKISVYDANTGTLITDKEMNMGGFWY